MKRFSSLFILCLLLVSMLAVSVSAAEPYTPVDFGKAITDTIEGLSNLFTGDSTSYDNWYLFSFILYFIIFAAIFYEGIHFLPLFGPKGDVNTAGKWFVFAAASLSTVSIFFIEQATEKTTRQLAQSLLTPFGVYGSFALAAFLGFMVFHVLKQIDLFEDHTIIAMTIAASVALTSVGYLLTSNTLLGWGFLIMLLVMVIGLISAFVGGRREAGELGEQGLEKDFWGRVKEIESPLKRFAKFGMVEHVWLDKLYKEVGTSANICGTTEADHGVDMRKDVRALKKMKSRENAVKQALQTVWHRKGVKLDRESMEFQGKVNGWLNKLDIYSKQLYKIAAKGVGKFGTGELDKLLQTPCATGGLTETQKKKQLLKLVKDAIDADTAILALVKEIEDAVDAAT